MVLFAEATSIFDQIKDILMTFFSSVNWDVILFAGLAFEVLFAIFYFIKSRCSYEVRVVKKLLKINNWLNKNRSIDQNNLIEFNNLMKHTPKHLRYYWHEYMLNRDKDPSYYMSTYNIVEKPLKTSSYLANIKYFKITSILTASIVFLFSLFKLGTAVLTFSEVAICVLTPTLILLIYGILNIIMRAAQNMNLNSLYQYAHYFGRFLDRAVTTMPEYVDFEVLFTAREIKKGIPVLNEYLEKRARQEQEELEKARVNAVEHETYDFSSTGINGSLILERAINESETFINIRSRLLSEIQQIEDEMESIKRTYENAQKDYQKKMQVSKENVDRLRKQQEETTNRIENNYIKKQQADEIKKQEQLEKDNDTTTARFNQEIEGLTKEIETRREELEERRKYVEDAMKAEYQTFSTKLYKSLTNILDEEHEDEKEELIEIKDEITAQLQQANDTIASRDKEIDELHNLLQANNIDYNAVMGFSSEELENESKSKKKKRKKDSDSDDKKLEEMPKTISPTENFANDPNLIPLDQITEDQKQYGEDGGFFDPNGYYRYANGTYFTPSSEYHDEFGGWYEADGVTYHAPENKTVQDSQEPPQQATDENGGHYGEDGNYYYPNGAYYTPDGRYFDELGGWYEADGKTYHEPENKTVQDSQEKPQQATDENGGHYGEDGNYYYPNGAYYTPDGRYFDELGGWYEADGKTYHEPDNKTVEGSQETQQQVTDENGGHYGDDGNYYYPNGAYYTPDGRYFDELGGWYEKDGKTYHKPDPDEEPKQEQKPIEEKIEVRKKFEDVPESEREYGEDGGFFDKEGYYYYPNGAYFTPDGRYFDEFGGWYETDGVTYHAAEGSENVGKLPKNDDDNEPLKLKNIDDDEDENDTLEYNTDKQLSTDAEQELAKLKNQFNLDINAENKTPKNKVEDKKLDDDDTEVAETQIDESLFLPSTEVNTLEIAGPSAEPETQTKVDDANEVKEEKTTAKKASRGRPKKVLTEEEKAKRLEPKKSRGRPKKVAKDEKTAEKKPVEQKRKRGRPAKAKQEKNSAEKPKKNRGRPKKSVTSKNEFDTLMKNSDNHDLAEIDKLNEKIADENKRLAEHQQQFDKQLTETLFQLSNDDEKLTANKTSKAKTKKKSKK